MVRRRADGIVRRPSGGAHATGFEATLGTGCFTPNFEEEWNLFEAWSRRLSAAGQEPAFCAGDSFSDLFLEVGKARG